MCGRYTQTKIEAILRKRFRLSSVEGVVVPRYNVAPGQDAPVVVAAPGGRVLRPMRWGLVPGWAKDPRIGSRLINARADTLAEKPAYREAFRSRRCLVPADGFYEWRKEGPRKVPLRYLVDGGEPFALAGLFEEPRARGEPPTFTIVTTEANPLVAEVHDRMPVILREEDEAAWVDPAREAAALVPLLAPFPPGRMEARRASTRLNRVENDDPACLEGEAWEAPRAPRTGPAVRPAQRSLFDEEE